MTGNAALSRLTGEYRERWSRSGVKQADSLNRQDPCALKKATDGDEMCHTSISSGPLRTLGYSRHERTHPTAISGTTKTTLRARHHRRRLVNQRNYTGLRAGKRSGTHAPVHSLSKTKEAAALFRRRYVAGMQASRVIFPGHDLCKQQASRRISAKLCEHPGRIERQHPCVLLGVAFHVVVGAALVLRNPRAVGVASGDRRRYQ